MNQVGTPIIGTMRLGEWGARLGPAAVAEFLAACVELGACDIDLADVYGNGSGNRLIGDAMARMPRLREQLRLIVKIGIVMPDPGSPTNGTYRYDNSARHLQAAFARTLEDLGVDRVAMLMLHRFDPLADLDALVGLVSSLLEQGRIGSFGVSNFLPSQLDLLAARLPVHAHQIELSVDQHHALDDGRHAHAQLRGCEVMAWSPLGGGRLLLAGQASAAKLTPTLQHLAHVYQQDSAQLLLRWVHSLPGTRAILGTHRIEHVTQAIDAVREPLAVEHWYQLLQAARGERLA